MTTTNNPPISSVPTRADARWTRAGVRHRGGRWYYLRLRDCLEGGWQPVQLAYDPHQILSGLHVGPQVDAFLNGKWSEWGALVSRGYERTTAPIPEPWR